MYSNRRRSHIHFIHQYDMNTNDYRGTRIVIFHKELGKKIIRDLVDFRNHRYKNPKSKRNKVSGWAIVNSTINNVIKKEMINTSINKEYKMLHILYESLSMELDEYMYDVAELELKDKIEYEKRKLLYQKLMNIDII